MVETIRTCGALVQATVSVAKILTVLFASMQTSIITVDELQTQSTCSTTIMTPLCTRSNISGEWIGGQ